MLTTTRSVGEQAAQALRWVASRGVEVVVEPRAGHRLRTGEVEHPTLYLVPDEGPAPQGWGELEDWIRLPLDPDEIYTRADRLIARAAATGASRTYVDEDDVLRAGPLLVPLGRIEAQLVRILLDRVGTLVPREELEAALWPCEAPADPRALDNRLARLRRRIQPIPVELHTVRGRGFLLERVSRPLDQAASSAS